MSDFPSALHWRYATKQFDPAKKIDTETWAKVEEALVFSPSSYGLQPWKFLVINDPELRKRLRPHAWNQAQITEASHLVVMCRKTNLDEKWTDKYIQRMAEVRGQNVSELEGLRKMLADFFTSLTPERQVDWSDRQVYLALGMALSTCANLKVDACPMEGFIPLEFDKELGLAEKGLASVVLMACGYRSQEDKYAKAPKVRFDIEEVIERI